MSKVLLLSREAGVESREWKMWAKAAEFWGLPYELADEATFAQVDETAYSLILVAGAEEIGASAANKLRSFAAEGGGVLISGPLPAALCDVFGGIRTRRIVRTGTHRCIRVVAEEGLGGWRAGDILFFTNTYQTAGTDYLVEGLERLEGHILGESEMMTLTDAESDSWGDWTEDPSPTIIARQVGSGMMLYVPLALGGMEWVTQPQIPTFKEFPYVVHNHALLLFMRSLFESAAAPGKLSVRPLWPSGAKMAVCITGDVHDYVGLGLGQREDREYKDMIDYMNVLQQFGLEGRATFYISGAVAMRHPEEIREGFRRGYEMCPHTYKDTCYSSAGFDYAAQKEDIDRCIREFRAIAPEHNDYAKGFRTHGYNSNYDTRRALERREYDYIADLQAWEAVGQHIPDYPEYPERLITYAALPQQTIDYRGRAMNLMEIPDSVVNDHFVYRILRLEPEQAAEFYKKEFDKFYRLGGLFQVNFHPYISLREGPGREAAFRDILAHIASHEDIAFLRMDELCEWWKGRGAPC